MNGTRAARMAALTAALVLGVALTAATLLTTGPRDGLHPDRTSAAVLDRVPVPVRDDGRSTTAAAPRTTPPPTWPVPAAPPARPAAAATVEHS